MHSIASLVAFLGAGVLLWAGLEKLRLNGAFAQTLNALRLPRAFCGVARVAIPLGEILVAAAIMLAPAAGWPRYGMMGFAIAFGIAGVLGINSGVAISCTCFGTTGGHVLGWAQLVALPGWVIAFVVLEKQPIVSAGRAGPIRLAALVLILAATRGVVLARATYEARGDRRALNEAAVRLTPIVAPLPAYDG